MLLGRGFYSKCKSLIKLTKSRIQVIRRKRKATQKFLKKDIAHLLAHGLDINAYGRADGLLVELALSSCYDCIEQSSDFVLKHLSLIQKQIYPPALHYLLVNALRNVGRLYHLLCLLRQDSLICQLRDLRQMFQEKYGNSLEYSVNKEFVEKLSSKPARMESKVQLMRDIALEFSVRWDSVAFEQRMSKPSASAQEQNKNYGSFHLPVDSNRLVMGKDVAPKGDKHKFATKERLELPPKYGHNDKKSSVSKRNGTDLHSRRGVTDNGYASLNGTKETVLKDDGNVILVRGKQEVVEKHGPRVHNDNTTPRKVRSGNSSLREGYEYIDNGFKLYNDRENPEFYPNCAGKSLRNGWDEEVDKLRPNYNDVTPPPYVKPKSNKDDRFGANLGSALAGSGSDGVTKDSLAGEGASISNRSDSARSVAHADHGRRNGLARMNGHDYEKDHHRFQDDPANNPIPKPKSVRRRHSRSQCNNEDAGNTVDTAVPARKSRSKRRDVSRRGLQILFGDERDEKEEEERVIDRLLMHYSKKPSIEPEELRRKSKNRHHQHHDPSKSPLNGSRCGPQEIAPVPLRSASLTHEPSAPPLPTKVFAQAASFQPERSNQARHVHPNLPNYDDLAARFASLKGT